MKKLLALIYSLIIAFTTSYHVSKVRNHKKTLTVLMILSCSVAFSQKIYKKKFDKADSSFTGSLNNISVTTLNFTEEEKLAYSDHQEDLQQQQKYIHDAEIRNKEWEKLLIRKVTAAKIKFDLISNNGDSLQILPTGIQLKLKPKKK
jgi:hypothetical protein